MVAEKPVIQRLVDLRNDLAHGQWKQWTRRNGTASCTLEISDMLELLCR